MYGQGGSFNPHYRHDVPLPPQAGVSAPFPQQPQPLPPPQQQKQAGVTGPFSQQPVPPPPASYPHHPGMQPPPQGAYLHGVPQFQNSAYHFSQHGQMHQMSMESQQRGFTPMPMSGPPPQAMYQGPQYPMQRHLPPPPPRPSSFAPENAPPPSDPPPPPPPPPPPSAPPLAHAPPTSVAQPWYAEVGRKTAPDGGDGAKTGKADTQLIVSDDSDMDMDGDEDSPPRTHLTMDDPLLVTAECTGDGNVAKSLSVVSRPGNDLRPGSSENAKTTNVIVEGGSPFRLIQGYSSDDNEDKLDAGVGSTHVTLCKDNEHTHLNDKNIETSHQKLAIEGNVNLSHGTEQNDKAREYHLKQNESNLVKQDIDVPGHMVEDDLNGSEFDGVQRRKRDGRSQRKRSRSKSPQDRSHSPLSANKCSPSQSFSPGRLSRSPLAKRVHPAGEGKDLEDRLHLQEGLVGIEKLHNSPSLSQSGLNVLQSAGNEILKSQSSGGVPPLSVQATTSSVACEVALADPQSLCPPEQTSSGFAQAHPSSSTMIRPPGPPSVAISEIPQVQFQQNVIPPANVQNQLRPYPAPDLSHPRPLNPHDHMLQPLTSHQQPAAIPVENAPVVPHPDRWSSYSGSIGLPYSCPQPSYGQQQPAGNINSGTNLIYPSLQRFPQNLPGSSDLGPVSDIDLSKSSIKPHYNPFASTFEQADPSLGIDPTLSPNAVGSFSTKAEEHMNTVSPFGQSFPGSGSCAHESSAEVAHNKQKQSRREFTSGAPYDPFIDSIEPSSSSINKVNPGKEKHWSADGSRDASKLINVEVDSKDILGLGVVAESEVEGLGEVAADTEAGVVENASPEFLGAKDWSSDIPGDIDNDQSLSKKAKDSRSMKLFKNAVADFVKEVLKPSWRQGNMSKEAFKTIVKKTVDKVSNSVPSSHIPKTPAKIKQYVQSSQKKVTKLVMGYVEKYAKL